MKIMSIDFFKPGLLIIFHARTQLKQKLGG